MATVMIKYEVTDCTDCPFAKYHYGHGECWYECINKDNGRASYENILWGCQEKFTQIPYWCPLPLPNKAPCPIIDPTKV